MSRRNSSIQRATSFPLESQEKFALLDICYRKGKYCNRVFLNETGRCNRYWEDEVQTKAVMKVDEEGTLWMHTGDEGIMDAEGYLRSE